VVARWQLLRLGATPGQIDGWVARGRLRPLHAGVYLVGPIVPPHAHEIAAVLACGPNAALSHRSAACLYALLPYPAQPAPVDVTVVGRNPRRSGAIRVHRSQSLRRHEVRERLGIPVTSPQRTLVDLAGCCESEELEAAIAEAFALGLTNRSQLLGAIEANPGKRGCALLRRQLHAERRPARTRSRPERTLVRLLRQAGVRDPEANVRVSGWEVDLFWPDVGLVVEIDAYATHSSPRAFERDRRKAAELEDLGLTVRRVSALQIRDEPRLTVARIERTLGELERA
jgi:very-short-patch-repair endonuclease